MTTVGFLHTSAVHVATFDRLLAELAPQYRSVTAIDETLLADARQSGPESVSDRVVAAINDLRAAGADIVCCTCSTIGGIAEHASVGIPAFRVDRPMAARAVQAATRIGVLAAVDSTLEPTCAVLVDEATMAGAAVDLRPVVVPSAWERFEAGDHDGYITLITTAARTLAPDVDAIVLAQASMANAETLLNDLPIPVLSSPRPAVEHLAATM